MYREFWNSQAALIRQGDVRDGQVEIGRLHEMVDFLLSQPEEERQDLLLTGDALDQPLDVAEAERLRRRDDFPLTC